MTPVQSLHSSQPGLSRDPLLSLERVRSVRTRSDTTPVNSDLICFPLFSFPTCPRSHSVSVPIVPHLGLCSFRRDSNPILYVPLRPRVLSYYVLVVPHSGLLSSTGSSDPLQTPFGLRMSYVFPRHMITLDRVSPLRSSAIFDEAHVIDLPLMPLDSCLA